MEACKEYTPRMRTALDDGSDMATLQCVVDLLEMPTRVFVPLLEEREEQQRKRGPKVRPPPDIPDPLGAGAGSTPRQEAAKWQRHEGPKVTVLVTQASSFLFRAAANDSTCMDAFGWSADYLFHVRATPFKQQLARLTARVGNVDVPDAVAITLSC